MGLKSRQMWVKTARRILLNTDGTDSGQARAINAKGILLECGQTVDQYLALMTQTNPGRAAWGGEGELHMLATMWECRICTLLFRTDPREGPQTRLLWGPLGTVGNIHTLLFNGTHYDLVRLTPEQLAMLGLVP